MVGVLLRLMLGLSWGSNSRLGTGVLVIRFCHSSMLRVSFFPSFSSLYNSDIRRRPSYSRQLCARTLSAELAVIVEPLTGLLYYSCTRLGIAWRFNAGLGVIFHISL